MPSGLAADVKTEGTRTCVHADLQQGSLADAVEWAVVGHLDADDGGKVIDGASGDLAAGPGLDLSGPLEQARHAHSPLVEASLAPFEPAGCHIGSEVGVFASVAKVDPTACCQGVE